MSIAKPKTVIVTDSPALDLSDLLINNEFPVLMLNRDFEIASARDTAFLVFDYHESLARIRKSKGNKIFYFITGSINSAILPLADAVVVDSYYAANLYMPWLKSYQMPIYRLFGFINIQRFAGVNRASVRGQFIGRCMTGKPSRLYNALHNTKGIVTELRFANISQQEYEKDIGTPIPNTKFVDTHRKVFENSNIYLHLDDSGQWDKELSEAIACGIPVITQNKGTMQEYLVDGFTGLLVSNENDIIEAIKALRDHQTRNRLSKDAKRLLQCLTRSNKYIDNLVRIFNGDHTNIRSLRTVAKDSKHWIFTDYRHTLPGADKYQIVRHLSRDNLLLTAIHMLAGTDFEDSYIFIDGFPELTRGDILSLRNDTKKFGILGIKFHICVDSAIPLDMKPLFSNVSIITREEAIKRLKYEQ